MRVPARMGRAHGPDSAGRRESVTKRKAPAKKQERHRVPKPAWPEFVAEYEMAFSAASKKALLDRFGIAERTAQNMRQLVQADPALAAECAQKRSELRDLLDSRLRDALVSSHLATLEAIEHQARLALDSKLFDPKVFFALTGGNKVAQEQGTARKVLDPDEQRIRPGSARKEPEAPAGEGEGGAGGGGAGAPGSNGVGGDRPGVVH